MFINYCKIGQLSRCKSSGCEWKKSFHSHCPSAPQFREPEIKKKYANSVMLKQEKEKGFESSNNMLIRIEKDVTKQKTVQLTSKKKKINIVVVNEESNSFKTPKQDDWIKKIKTI